MTLTHYTRDINSVVGVLKNGFAWIPNRRQLIRSLVPEHDFSRREPQQFGMISFTEASPEDAGWGTFPFGRFGISVSEEWSLRNKVERVIYVPEDGATFMAWRALFKLGYRDLIAHINYPDDKAWLMSFENKAMAGSIGAMSWAYLLQLYEYMEPAANAYQREWRMVHPHPYYSLVEDKLEALARVSPPQGWGEFLDVVKITPADVRALICPRSEHQALLAAIPMVYRDIKIRTLGD